MLYEIIVGGHIPEAWFKGFTIVKQPDFTTTLRGHLIDQAALYGVLRIINDLGVELIAVNRLDDGE